MDKTFFLFWLCAWVKGMINSSTGQIHRLFLVYPVFRDPHSAMYCTKEDLRKCAWTIRRAGKADFHVYCKKKKRHEWLLFCLSWRIKVYRSSEMSGYTWTTAIPGSALCNVGSTALWYKNGSHFLGQQSPVDILTMSIWWIILWEITNVFLKPILDF